MFPQYTKKLAIIYFLTLSYCLCADPCSADTDGFITLFDGNSLKGWIGATESVSVDNGLLITKQGGRGNLLTEREYSDFVFRFEFRLTAGANNGVGVRVPKEGDGSYNGIELQILDDTAERYRELKPYQYHGSAYGIAPAIRGALLPVGSWNKEEVRCEGRHITVVLNGKKILDIDLDNAAPHGKTIDGVAHPGLDNTQGHIGFLCHDDVVAFRNIRIKDLSAKTSDSTP